MLHVPLQVAPSQILNVTLGGQPCTLRVYQKSTGLFVDLYVNGALIIGGVIGLNRTHIVRTAYLGFIGDLAFFDTQGADDPVYTGFGGRWILIYLEPADAGVGR